MRRSVDSILNQSFRDFEFLICDDGSAEAARRELERYAAADKRVRLLREGGRLTLPAKLNLCIQNARGAFVARMDDDDASRPERFTRQLEALSASPEIAFVGSNVSLVRDGVTVGKRRLPEYPEVKDFLMTQPYVHPTLMFRRAALLAVGGYSEDKYCLLCEDYDLLLRLYEAGFCGWNLQETLLDYTAPDVRGNRTMLHRRNESVTRFRRYRALGLLPGAFPYVVKPLAAGLLPGCLLGWAKEHYHQKHG